MSAAVHERAVEGLGGDPSIVRRARSRRRRRYLAGCAVLTVVLVALALISLCLGDRDYSLHDVWQVVLGQQVPGASFTVGRLRLPRVIIGILVGVAFGLGGIVFQTMLRNGLASPDVIGITWGSSVGAVIGIVVLGLSSTMISAVSLISGLLVAGAIYLLAYRDGLSATRLVLTGIAAAAIFQGVINYLLLRAGSYDVQTALRWLSGSLNSAFWDVLPPLLYPMLVLVPLLGILATRLRILQLGDLSATSLGLSTERTRLGIILVAVCLIGVATAATGPVAFVALLAGPIAVRITGAGGALLPSALVGAVLVLGGDFVGSHLLGVNYPVGTVTGAIGAPYLLWQLARSSRSGASL